MESELRSYCRRETLSEEGLREIIQRHGLTPNNHHRLGNYGFFLSACINERVTEGIIRCLLEYFPDAANVCDDTGWSPLHFACGNENVTLNIIQLIIAAAPTSLRSTTNSGNMPLHILCLVEKVNEVHVVQILKLLIDKYPEAVRHADNDVGILPIHNASGRRSPEFCRVLIEAYPGSEQITTTNGKLPLHWACAYNSPATVEYLYRIFPDAIHASTLEEYPVHVAISSMEHRNKPAVAVKVVQCLLDCDPNQMLKQFQGNSLLHFACGKRYGHSNIEAGIQMIKVLFDAHPEAIEDNRIATNIHRYHYRVQEFLNNQLFFARQAKDHRLMTTPDNNGHLPLHRALQNNVRLGSIKLLVKGNPVALQSADNSGALPLHVACQHHDSVNEIQYLVELDQSTLEAMDGEGNTALHLACRRGRHDIISLLLDEFDAVSVSKRNADEKLPIDLLWESTEVDDRESIEYTESVYRLLRANPEMIMGCDVHTMQYSASDSPPPCQSGKKRKLGQ